MRGMAERFSFATNTAARQGDLEGRRSGDGRAKL
ncbi:hypothetical protein EV191_10648 [Tamaricihabitans halophyticus]|uniref:Uncharacterized protein n=1 Tax=Tamaricihabitans halophyticus TaxID=1262583 RepID=A0A4R2QS13_9PSEU|nr:hypothetical protein EV191_10648 [Tamaricihabitans halophyticus]